MTFRMDPKANYGLWWIIMSHYRFILGENCTTFANNTDNGEGYACGVQEHIGNL